MGIDDSGGVTSLVGLDRFVVRAQVYDGEQWWLAVEIAAVVVGCEFCGARAVGHGRRRVKVRICRCAVSRSRWCGPNGSGAVPMRIARPRHGRRVPRSSWRGRCSLSGPEPTSLAGSGPVRNRSLGWLVGSGCRSPRRWTRCAITASHGLIICPGWVPRRPSAWTRHRFSKPLASTRHCW